MVVLSPDSDVASALWLRHCGLAQEPYMLLLPLCCRACLSACFYEKAWFFVGISWTLFGFTCHFVGIPDSKELSWLQSWKWPLQKGLCYWGCGDQIWGIHLQTKGQMAKSASRTCVYAPDCALGSVEVASAWRKTARGKTLCLFGSIQCKKMSQNRWWDCFTRVF